LDFSTVNALSGTLMEPTPPIVFYDGVCGMCNQVVQWLSWLDRAGRLKYAPLQGETAARILPPQGPGDPDSVQIWTTRGIASHSTAVCHVLWELPWYCRPAGWLLWIIPKPLRDWGYRWVARHRYGWFGRYDQCRLPTSAERARLLP
ncbi:MAG: thiol-disulfide oxidoreductase DCC family protein, partial [Planctomycetaceae bacterium]